MIVSFIYPSKVRISPLVVARTITKYSDDSIKSKK